MSVCQNENVLSLRSTQNSFKKDLSNEYGETKVLQNKTMTNYTIRDSNVARDSLFRTVLFLQLYFDRYKVSMDKYILFAKECLKIFTMTVKTRHLKWISITTDHLGSHLTTAEVTRAAKTKRAHPSLGLLLITKAKNPELQQFSFIKGMKRHERKNAGIYPK